MSFLEDYNRASSDFAKALGGFVGDVAGSELILKPAIESQKKRRQLDQAIFSNDFALAAKLAQELGLAGDEFDYETEKRPTGVVTETPRLTKPLQGGFADVASGKVAGLQNIAAGLPDLQKPNPLLKGIKSAYDLPSLKEKSPLESATSFFQQGVVSPERKSAAYQNLLAAAEGRSPLALSPSKDFTVAKEIFKTENIADTPENRRRLMSLYTGKIPGYEIKQDYNDAIYAVREPFGLLPSSAEIVVPGGISDVKKMELSIKEKEQKRKQDEFAERMRVAIRGQDITKYGHDLSARIGQMRIAQSGVNTKILAQFNKNKQMAQGIIDDATRASSDLRNRLIQEAGGPYMLMSNKGKMDEINRRAQDEFVRTIKMRSAPLGDEQLTAMMENVMLESGTEDMPGVTIPVAIPAPARRPQPTPAAPAPRPQPAATARPKTPPVSGNPVASPQPRSRANVKQAKNLVDKYKNQPR